MKYYLTACLLFSGSILASEVGSFDVHVFATGTLNNSISNAFAGWECSSSSRISYQEKLPDHRGGLEYVNRDSAVINGRSVFENPSVKMEFKKDMNESSRIVAKITESCSKTVYNYNTDLSEVKTKSMTWACTFNEFPNQIGSITRSSCAAETRSQRSSDYNVTPDPFEILINELERNMDASRNSTFRAELKLVAKEEEFVANLCQGSDLSKRKIIKITQGLDSFSGEDDFVISINIRGLPQPIKLYRKSGILNEEIAICTDENINISVSALEQDIIWDDIYNCLDGDSSSVNLSLRTPGANTQYLRFNRPGLWSQFFLDKEQQMKLEIRASPVN